MRLFLSPTLSLEVRGPDDYALTGGRYGARRTKEGRNVLHQGVDLVIPPKARLVVPCSGVLTHVGAAYPGSTLHWLKIRPEGTTDVEFVVGYCDPWLLDVGDRQSVIAARLEPKRAPEAISTLGFAEDLASKYPDPDGAGPKRSIVNHVHVEIRVNGSPVDPLPWLRTSLAEV